MIGRGKDPITSFENNDLLIYNFKLNDWEHAQYPLHDKNDPVFAVKADKVDSVSPALACIAEIKSSSFPSDQSLGILLCARGGTGLSKWVSNNVFMREMLTRYRAASRAGNQIAGAFIFVGEGDTDSIEAADNWIVNFDYLVDYMRREFSDPNLPIIFAQLANISGERRSKRVHQYIGWDRLKQNQASYARHNVGMIKTDDLDLSSDGLHLTSLSNYEVGKRFAKAFLSISKS